jgi:hypothetical protein
MRIYAYVPGDDREWIRRCDVHSNELRDLLVALGSLGVIPWLHNVPSHTLQASEVLVALDWLDERGTLPPALGERLRRETKVQRWLLYRSGKLPRELLVHHWPTPGPSTWRERFRPYLAAVLRQLDGQDQKHRDQALREAFPAGQRRMHPYKTWLDEIRAQRGLRRPLRSGPQVRQDHPKQELMFGGAS